MGQFFAVQGDGHGIYLVGDFVNFVAAQVFMDDNNIPGNPVDSATYLLAPYQTGVDLEDAKIVKLGELKIETVVHYQSVDPLIDNFAAVYTASVMATHLTPLGGDLVDVNVAVASAVVTITGFGDVNDVENYDVVNDPAWP